MRVNKKKLPEIHIDIESHNVNPRRKRAVTAKSRSPVRKAPVKRQANPVKNMARTEIMREFRVGINALAKEKDDLSRQAALSYVQGILHAGFLCGALTQLEAHELRETLKNSAGVK